LLRPPVWLAQLRELRQGMVGAWLPPLMAFLGGGGNGTPEQPDLLLPFDRL